MALEAAYDYLHVAVVQCTPTQAAAVLGVLLLLAIRLAAAARSSSATSPKWKQHRLPPTPPGKLPIIGHLHLIGSHPHVSFRDLHAKYGHNGLMLVQVGAVPTIVVSTPQAAEAVLRTHDHVLASRPRNPVADIIRYNSTDVAFAPYGEYWRTARKVVNTHLLSAKMVFSKRREREEEVRLVVARIRDAAEASPGTALDMTELLGGYASDFVCRAVLGESHRKQGRNKLFRELTETSAALLGGFNVEDYFPKLADVDLFLRIICAKAKGVSKRWDSLFNELLSEYALSGGKQGDHNSEDFVHLLLSLQKDYGLTTDNIKGILVNMFEAAIETSFLVLEYSMSELMNNRHVLAKLQKEVRTATPDGRMVMEEDLSRMPYLKATIKESMRIHPPAPFLLPHFSTHDCEINGYTIPAGTRVIVNAWALARDPTCWDKAEEFFPERFLEQGRDAEVDMYGKDIRFVPFGAGRRICAGATFAIATVEIMLANLIYHFDWEMPAEMERTGAKVDMSDQFGMTLRRTQKLYLVPRIPK
ncbi:3-hydroxyindolin-2-one monooxygenase [Zea mays]|uniref:Benzoxazinone synthesis4 n=2 Tax=Zea mays TaxID=4577 RepID=B6UC65_MAIZE|nr:3-hydroxyindolin-2-one monooxygenase [Zea mays]ACG46948.1 cytochrome P450 CYP71C1 [Zea mays]ACN25432.1 unknown [Zea mays]ACN30612.1 unknown [Zea mays]AQK48632.1 benzoxazinone synthesis4 [Zea mays]PWZ27680.1 3-hydroxyindolin-2-one monooxygenase [Zea mays]|eukprot:NP_001281233.1 3-hydroxyindolin-2-one monooxygenase [Zea mays]